jgi:hypothetical protein
MQQIQSEFNTRVKTILEDFLKTLKTKKRKKQFLRREKEKLVKVILSIVQIAIVLIHLIEPLLLQNNHSRIIAFLCQVISLIKI